MDIAPAKMAETGLTTATVIGFIPLSANVRHNQHIPIDISPKDKDKMSGSGSKVKRNASRGVFPIESSFKTIAPITEEIKYIHI